MDAFGKRVEEIKFNEKNDPLKYDMQLTVKKSTTTSSQLNNRKTKRQKYANIYN